MPLTAPRPMTDRLSHNNFDLLRMVFAGMVVLFHIGILSQSPALHWLEAGISSTYAVQAFFFVSGFLVTMSHERSSSLGSYASKRLRRIAPAYLVVVLGAAVLLVTMSRLSVAEYFLSPGWRDYVVYNLLLSNFSAPSLPGVFEGNHESAVNGSLWTIKIEVAFYCMVPLVAWLGRRIGHVRSLALVFLLSLAWKTGFQIAQDHTGLAFYGKLAKQLPGQLSFFAGGALAYHRTKADLPAPPWWAAVAGVLLYTLTDGMVHELLAPVAVTLSVYWASVGIPQLIQAGRHGDFSYGLYLYHFPFVQTLIALGWFASHPIGSAFFMAALAMLIAVVSWYGIERPFLRRRPG
jgi:peptidoglycan/LPS O-acetylase OafA/YrhL